MRRIKVTLSYDGTDFHGWQVQPGQVTIQSIFQEVLSEIEEAPVVVAASGRTDAGVHALEQVAAFTFRNPIPPLNLLRALNRLLPKAIRVLSVEEVHADFHPRYDAIAKTYEYRIWRREICPPFLRRYVHHHPYPIDAGKMIEFAPLLEGEHDFWAFSAADPRDAAGHSKVRTIFSSKMADEGEMLVYRVRGSGFLKYMVRAIAGTLLEVGKGNHTKEQFLAFLQPRPAEEQKGRQRKAGPRASPGGLFLVSVEYPEPGSSAAASSREADPEDA